VKYTFYSSGFEPKSNFIYQFSSFHFLLILQATSKLEEAMIRAMESMSNSCRNIKKYHAEALNQNPPTNESLFWFVI
jgi:hypothetical protein